MQSHTATGPDVHEGRQQQSVEGFVRDTLRAAGLELDFTCQVRGEADLYLEFTGLDVPALLARNAELLLALEHLATQVLRLQPEEHERISFDAQNFKRDRARKLEQEAIAASRQVRLSGRPFEFRPMNSRERRLLHLALASSGLHAASVGEGPARHLVLHPMERRA